MQMYLAEKALSFRSFPKRIRQPARLGGKCIKNTPKGREQKAADISPRYEIYIMHKARNTTTAQLENRRRKLVSVEGEISIFSSSMSNQRIESLSDDY